MGLEPSKAFDDRTPLLLVCFISPSSKPAVLRSRPWRGDRRQGETECPHARPQTLVFCNSASPVSVYTGLVLRHREFSLPNQRPHTPPRLNRSDIVQRSYPYLAPQTVLLQMGAANASLCPLTSISPVARSFSQCTTNRRDIPKRASKLCTTRADRGL